MTVVVCVLLHIEAVKQVFPELHYRECIARECYKEQQVACTAAVNIDPRQFQDSLRAYFESSDCRHQPVRLQEWHYRSVHYDPIESREVTVIIVLQMPCNITIVQLTTVGTLFNCRSECW